MYMSRHATVRFQFYSKYITDVEIVGGESGVTFTFTRDGRPSGEAYVCVASPEDKAAAIHHNREHIGSRYIEGN